MVLAKKLLVVLLVALGLFFGGRVSPDNTVEASQIPRTLSTFFQLPDQINGAEKYFKSNQAPFSTTIIMGPNDDLLDVLSDAGASRAEASAASAALTKIFNLKHITEGQEIVINFKPRFGVSTSMGLPDRFVGFSFFTKYPQQITVSKSFKGEFVATAVKHALKRRLVRAVFTIEDSLSNAASKAGLPSRVQAELVRIFSWDIDFQRDIHPGDDIEIMFERYRGEDGTLLHEGRILYASMRLSGVQWPIYYHVTKDGKGGYFKKNGQSARRALLRTPIDGARITSGFGKRQHPILGYMEEHRGVDFAAPWGTPIFAAGDGVVDEAGYNELSGKYMRIHHNGEYSTAYAHMSRININAGSRVHQGQVIGYVGSSGRSTGPHLHFEILKKSQRTNPLKVSMPSGRILKGEELDLFKKTMSVADYKLAYLSEDAKPSLFVTTHLQE